jgi:hypothetical protein
VSAGAMLQVTPTELAAAAAQADGRVRLLAAQLRSARTTVAGLATPDPRANPLLLSRSRELLDAVDSVSTLLAELIERLCHGLAAQAEALRRAAGGYEYVERRVGAAFRPGRSHGE